MVSLVPFRLLRLEDRLVRADGRFAFDPVFRRLESLVGIGCTDVGDIGISRVKYVWSCLDGLSVFGLRSSVMAVSARNVSGRVTVVFFMALAARP